MRQTRTGKYSFILIAALVFVTLPAWGTVIVLQQGANDPTLNGFVAYFGVTSQGPVGATAWNIQGSWFCGADIYSLKSNRRSDYRPHYGHQLGIHRNVSKSVA